MTTKADIRKTYLDNMPTWLASHPEAADRIAHYIVKLGWPEQHIISAYWATPKEIPTLPLLQKLFSAGHRLALPHVHAAGDLIHFHAWQYNTDAANNYGLELDKRKMWAPPISASEVLPDVVIAPVTAFDTTGTRLGKGRGDYDRAIAHLRIYREKALYVGIALDEQQTEELIPAEPHDVRLDLVITPKGVITPKV